MSDNENSKLDEWETYDNDETTLKMGFKEEDEKGKNLVINNYINPLIVEQKASEYDNMIWKRSKQSRY